ncbi:MAG TPA: hypothetical protein ENK89_00690 [Desulfobulbaceae bacterium]|nr:hypothetical protein [Desulfobulbaceae bacterium]
MFIDVLNEKQRAILPKLANALKETDLYLAGGTALALQVGHRPSIDFDWFGNEIGDPEILFYRLRAADLDFTISTNTFETVYVEIETVQVRFFGYNFPMLMPFCKWGEYGIQMASLDDIACMKLSAVTNRGSRKDFIDLHYLISHYRSLGEYLQLFQRKFQQQDIGHVIRSLVFF